MNRRIIVDVVNNNNKKCINEIFSAIVMTITEKKF